MQEGRLNAWTRKDLVGLTHGLGRTSRNDLIPCDRDQEQPLCEIDRNEYNGMEGENALERTLA